MGSDDGCGWVGDFAEGTGGQRKWEARRQRERASKQGQHKSAIMKSIVSISSSDSISLLSGLMSSNYCYLKIPSTNDILEFKQPPYLPPSTYLLLSLCHVRRNVDKVRRRQQTP